MFIPTWLIVVIVVLVVLHLGGRYLWEELKTLALLFGCLGMLASFLLAIYFYATGNLLAAGVAAAPLLLFGLWDYVKFQVWAGGTLNESALDTRLRWFRLRSRGTQDARAIADRATKLASSIGLGPTLWKLYEEIKYFPSWYSKPDWEGSAIITRDHIRRLTANDVSILGIDRIDRKTSVEGIVWSFSAQGSDYSLVVVDKADAYAPDPFESEWADSKYLSGLFAHDIYVIRLPGTKVLKIRLYYKAGVDWDTYRHDYIEAFRPASEWIVSIYKATLALQEEDKQRSKALMDRLERERAKNFGDS